MIENRFFLLILKRFISSKYSRLLELETLVIIVFLGLNVFVLSLFGSANVGNLSTYQSKVALKNIPPPPPPTAISGGQVKGEVLAVNASLSIQVTDQCLNDNNNRLIYVNFSHPLDGATWELEVQLTGYSSVRGDISNISSESRQFAPRTGLTFYARLFRNGSQQTQTSAYIASCGGGGGNPTPTPTPQGCNVTSPSAPSLNYPGNGDSLSSSTAQVSLDWWDVNNWGTECNGTDNRIYAVFFGTNPDPPFYVYSSDSYEVAQVSSGNTYYWRIKAMNKARKFSNYSELRSFSVGAGGGNPTPTPTPRPSPTPTPSTTVQPAYNLTESQ